MLSSIAWDQSANGLFERKSPDSVRVLMLVVVKYSVLPFAVC